MERCTLVAVPLSKGRLSFVHRLLWNNPLGIGGAPFCLLSRFQICQCSDAFVQVVDLLQGNEPGILGGVGLSAEKLPILV